jgi:hypothetical protein
MSTLSIFKFRASIFTAVLALAPLSPALHAQGGPAFAQVNVPFAFETGSGHYPAGVYKLDMDSPSILKITGASNSGLAMMRVVDDRGRRTRNGVATFHRYGTRYFLNEISATGESRHIHLQQSKAEKQAQKQMETAAVKSEPANLEVALIDAR